ncbi:DNA repair protein RadC [Thiorhodococcus drewsii AZ1]|uniref:DNA repair protein RadC n=1 Tax=Thiorhodococcus drewsii AZ1 TaxID=765913 RepID=G2E6X6_9GAMM|nr:DNA repair protein RadC [Thiorhodococcus drewsii AZ1]
MSTPSSQGALRLVSRGSIAIDRVRAEEDRLIHQAMGILERRMRRVQDPQALTAPALAHRYLQLRLGTREHEVFGAIWLDQRHRVLGIEELFRGTIDGASVHPREVVKQALRINAAACILFHNHPSGLSEPSSSDRAITGRLKDALALMGVRLLDHLIVGEDCLSMAEHGLL